MGKVILERSSWRCDLSDNFDIWWCIFNFWKGECWNYIKVKIYCVQINSAWLSQSGKTVLVQHICSLLSCYLLVLPVALTAFSEFFCNLLFFINTYVIWTLVFSCSESCVESGCPDSYSQFMYFKFFFLSLKNIYYHNFSLLLKYKFIY